MDGLRQPFFATTGSLCRAEKGVQVMSSTLMMERTGMGVQGVGVPGFTAPTMGTQPGMHVGANWFPVPRCTFKFEKCSGGVKFHCHCEDELARSTVQNLCTMLAGGMCSVSVFQNGMTVTCFNFTQGQCKFEPTDHGFCFSCVSGDNHWSQMLQSFCECVGYMMECGCTCCFFISNTPVCWGSYESHKGSGSFKNKSGK
jgi:hypothetical protein